MPPSLQEELTKDKVHACDPVRAGHPTATGADVLAKPAAVDGAEVAGCDGQVARGRYWTEQVLLGLFALRGKGDFAGMLARFAPDFAYNPGDMDPVAAHGERMRSGRLRRIASAGQR